VNALQIAKPLLRLARRLLRRQAGGDILCIALTEVDALFRAYFRLLLASPPERTKSSAEEERLRNCVERCPEAATTQIIQLLFHVLLRHYAPPHPSHFTFHSSRFIHTSAPPSDPSTPRASRAAGRPGMK